MYFPQVLPPNLDHSVLSIYKSNPVGAAGSVGLAVHDKDGASCGKAWPASHLDNVDTGAGRHEGHEGDWRWPSILSI